MFGVINVKLVNLIFIFITRLRTVHGEGDCSAPFDSLDSSRKYVLLSVTSVAQSLNGATTNLKNMFFGELKLIIYLVWL